MQKDKILVKIYSRAASTASQLGFLKGFLSGTLFGPNSASVLPFFCLCSLKKKKKKVAVVLGYEGDYFPRYFI